MDQCEHAVLFPDYQDIKEVEPHFIITPDEEIVFSANCNGRFKLIEYDNDSIEELNIDYDYIINPVLIQDEVAGLWDQNSNEKYRFTSSKIDAFLNSQPIRSALSSPNGNFLLYIPKNRNDLHLLDPDSMDDVFISRSVAKTNHICFDKLESYFVFPQNNKVFQYDITEKRLREIITGLGDKKLNLFTIDDELYFVNNDTSEFYNIYKCDLKDSVQKAKLVLSLNHDLRLPKWHGRRLFFIKVVNGEYLLHYRDLENGDIEQLTDKGVVYDYQFYMDKIVFTYSDFSTPKCLRSIDIYTSEIKTLFGSEEELGLGYTYIKKSPERSGAYIFSPPDSVNTKGTVLFIHAGLHSDFSPRWEYMLMGLCLNGYRIISPNYPGSCGYGKSYRSKDLNEALWDLVLWRKHIVEIFGDTPIYCLSVSSGNVLMEYFLLAESDEIEAAVSFIGVPSGREPEYHCPVLYILGENDPTVNFNARKNQLMHSKSQKVMIKSYPDEGHGIRKPSNKKDLIESIVCFLELKRK